MRLKTTKANKYRGYNLPNTTLRVYTHSHPHIYVHTHTHTHLVLLTSLGVGAVLTPFHNCRNCHSDNE